MTDLIRHGDAQVGHGSHPPAGSRLLLRQIRQLMADKRSDEERLDRVVNLIAANMVTEVCSIYVLKGRLLVLFATEGLNKSAVQKATLAVGQGLVGEIARTAEPLNLSDAQTHPNFAYLPETGEDPFQSFLGVPILRLGTVLGVLTVQNRTHRHYDEDEVEALQTIAMVLAEMLPAEGAGAAAAEAGTGSASGPLSLDALVLAEGVAIGRAVLHEPRVRVTRLIAEDTDAELSRLDGAIEKLQASVDTMLLRSDVPMTGESRDILETYRLFAHDQGWSRRLREAVLTGLTAEAAVERVQSDSRARMTRQRDPYLRERLHDLDDLANRLLRLLAGKQPTVQRDELPGDAIILARTMGPAELLDYDRSALKGLVLAEGTSTSHVAIVARALGIPILGRVEDVLSSVEPDDRLIVDGEVGELHIRPTADLIKTYTEKLALRAQREAQFALVRDVPAVTRDGTHIRLMMNAGLIADLSHLSESGAEGIGLFRTELQFMVRSTMPRLKAQTELYARVFEAAGGRPVVFRTVDLGGDKVVPYMRPEREDNPALGWRAIRIALDRPGLLKYQTRALVQAAAGRPLRLMFPMVSTVNEFEEARSLVISEVGKATARGLRAPEPLEIGTMLEVPALAYSLDELLPLTDFVSIGTNDLLQFFYAADRQNPRLADRYELLSAPFLRLLRHIVRAGAAHRVPVSLCGEMAGRPLEAMALLGVGLGAISIPAPAIGPIKMMVRSLQLGELRAFMDGLLADGRSDVREALVAFAMTRNVVL